MCLQLTARVEPRHQLAAEFVEVASLLGIPVAKGEVAADGVYRVYSGVRAGRPSIEPRHNPVDRVEIQELLDCW